MNRPDSPDPILNTANPASLNPYTYALNNPRTYQDATGLEPRPWHNPNYNATRCIGPECQPGRNGTDGYGYNAKWEAKKAAARAPATRPAATSDDDDGGVGGFLKKVGSGIKDAAGGIGNGAWKAGPGLVGTIGNLVLPDALGGDAFENTFEGWRASLEEMYGANTNSRTYRWLNLGTEIAVSLAGGAGAVVGGVKVAIRVGRAARGALGTRRGRLNARADRIEQHLTRLDHSPANDAMLARIRGAASNGTTLSRADRAFMRHESTEAWLMNRGMGSETAHRIAGWTHRTYGNYDPSVIKQFPEGFNRNWRSFWGIE